MALSRNERRRLGKLRNARRETNASNTAKVEAKAEVIRRNLSRSPSRENSRGLVFDYSPSVNPVGFTRPLRWTKGAANVGH
jgi:hypothetical protein